LSFELFMKDEEGEVVEQEEYWNKDKAKGSYFSVLRIKKG